MNYIDIVICIPLVWGLYKGFSKGLILEAASFVAFASAVYCALHFSDFVAEKIKEWFDWNSSYLEIVGFAVTFLGVVILVYATAKLVQKLAEGMALGVINKIGGAAFGSLKYALVMSVAIFVISAVEKSYPEIIFEKKEKSLLYKPVGMVAPFLIPGLRNSDFSSVFPQRDDVDVKVGLKENGQ